MKYDLEPKSESELHPLSLILHPFHPPLADAEKIQIVEMDEPDANQMAEKRKEYRKIFQ